MLPAPRVTPAGAGRCRVEGVFFRGVDPAHADTALAGSRAAGRYSSAVQPTLYLSASRDGVAAAMRAHARNRAVDLAVVEVDVVAADVVDLREPADCAAADVDPADAAAPWQGMVAAGGEPQSWGVRRRLEERGAAGLIDPSRQRQGLWHHVLFRWNGTSGPTATPR